MSPKQNILFRENNTTTTHFRKKAQNPRNSEEIFLSLRLSNRPTLVIVAIERFA